MTGAGRFFLFSGLGALLALAGCGRSMLLQSERPVWRQQAEAQCMQSGAVKLGAGVVQIKPIEGPGMCGANFPLKVAALGETGTRFGYSDIPRPPGGIANSPQMPDWPASQTRYVQPVPAQQLRWTPGAPAIGAPQTAAPQNYPQQNFPQQNYLPPNYRPQPSAPQTTAPQTIAPQTYAPRNAAPAGRPVSLYPQGVARPDDIPDDAVLPPGRAMPSRAMPRQVQPRQVQPAYNAPPPSQRTYTPPALGPARAPRTTGAILPATLKPAATLSCPIVSALERWVTEGVQPAALHWFGSQVVEIKQISAYSCRQMNGKGGRGISEHAFGNALDIAGFTLADGRNISVQKGWKGKPEEQGFLHDVQLFACQTFVTVLAPGYNAAHYNHFHVDLQRRKNGRRPCRPRAIKGEVVAARARAVYASKHGGATYTGSIATQDASDSVPEAVPGADGLFEDDNSDDSVTGSISKPATSPAQEVVEAVPGADGLSDELADALADKDENVTGSIGGSSAGWPRLAPISSTAIH